MQNLRNQINSKLPAGTTITYADMYQLAGAVAVEATGGPSIFASVPVGRVDATSADPTVALLPDKTDPIGKIECTFATDGYTMAEMVALTGAHTIGFTHPGANAARIQLSPTPFAFNTDYFQGVVAGQGVLQSDRALMQDTTLTAPLVTGYASNQAGFFNDFTAAYVKMGKMGATWQSYGP